MVIKTFRGQTMEEALAKVKATLGPSALIIETRTVSPQGPLGFLRKPLVEVVVGVEEAPVPAPRRAPGPATPLDWSAEAAMLRSIEAEVSAVKEALRALAGDASIVAETPVRELARVLAGQGFDRDTATALAQEAHAEKLGAGEPLERLRTVLARRFLTAGDEAPRAEGGPRLVAFVGPPGAGKSTLLARLAGRCVLGRGEKVAMASMDFFRVGALEQLKAYAEILGASFHAVAGPEAVQRVLEASRSAAWLLVDTPGLACYDEARLADLAAWLGAFPGLERHLVLSATGELQATLEAVEAYRRVGFERVAFTRVDEARRGGILLAGAAAAGVPVSYLGVGQDVAADLEVAEPARLAELVLDTSSARPVRPRSAQAEEARRANVPEP